MRDLRRRPTEDTGRVLLQRVRHRGHDAVGRMMKDRPGPITAENVERTYLECKRIGHETVMWSVDSLACAPRRDYYSCLSCGYDVETEER